VWLGGTGIDAPAQEESTHSLEKDIAMRVRIIAILGALVGALILIVATLSVNGTALHSFQSLDQQARQQDKAVASASAAPCDNPRLEVSEPVRVLAVSQTEAIRTQVTNQDTIECDIIVSLVAPNFTLQPADNQRLLQLKPTQSSTVAWNVTPTTAGLFTLAFTAGNASTQIGINVVSANGFIPLQAQSFDYLAIFFGFLLTAVSLAVWLRWMHRGILPTGNGNGSKPQTVAANSAAGTQP
jgi:hypothetical protein